MRAAAVCAVAAFATLSGCQSPPPPRPAPEMVVVLPGPDGRTGTVVVERGGERIVLDQPYAASRTGAQGASAPATEQEVRKTFGDALGTMPARPASFQLYFVTGSDTLTEQSRDELGRMLDELRRRPSPDIVVIGHTDRVGQDDQNDRLSLQRAERVKVDLVTQGLPADRIRTAGRGEREPVVPTADGIDEPRNRRVEINVR